MTFLPEKPGRTQGVIAWSSLLFAILQSVCTFFAALSGLRLAIGVGAFALASGAGVRWDKIFHPDKVRIPMIVLALVGSLLNLAVIAHMRWLRNRPASQWRRVPLTSKQLRMERLQIALSILTLLLVIIEELYHHRNFHIF